jgi:hypothetical protein
MLCGELANILFWQRPAGIGWRLTPKVCLPKLANILPFGRRTFDANSTALTGQRDRRKTTPYFPCSLGVRRPQWPAHEVARRSGGHADIGSGRQRSGAVWPSLGSPRLVADSVADWRTGAGDTTVVALQRCHELTSAGAAGCKVRPVSLHALHALHRRWMRYRGCGAGAVQPIWSPSRFSCKAAASFANPPPRPGIKCWENTSRPDNNNCNRARFEKQAEGPVPFLDHGGIVHANFPNLSARPSVGRHNREGRPQQ